MSMDSILEARLLNLYARRNSGIKLGLDVQRALMAEMGNPQDSYAVIHVAGTNGKGSVCALVASVLAELGFRVGLYVSPHLVEFNERISVNGVNATDDELIGVADAVDKAVPVVRDACGREPTFFEYATAMALKHFESKNVQVAVLEVGMGGRLDATNVTTPLVSAVTRISLEHTEFLGDSLPDIAAEKAGIIKTGRPVVCGMMPEEARDVIRERARAEGCLLREVEDSVSANLIDMSMLEQTVGISTENNDYGRIRMKLIGKHQIENLATAIAVIEECERAMGLEFPLEKIKSGIAAAVWRGRFHVISESPPMVLDGAHNAGAAQALAASLKQVLGKRPLGLILGICGDKDVASFVKSFGKVAKVWAVTIRNERSLPAEDLAGKIGAAGLPCVAADLATALEQSETWATEVGGAVCIAGSLFLVGEVLEMKVRDE